MFAKANVMALVAVGAVAVLLIIGLLLRIIFKKPEKHPDLAPHDNSVADSLAARLSEHGHKAAKPDAAAPEVAKEP